MKTYSPKHSEIERKWFVVDVKGKTLGSVATKMAEILRGKNKPIYAPHVDCGDYIIAINVADIHLTGSKWDQKTYSRHTGYPGGLKQINAADLKIKKPEKILQAAVSGMIPHNKLKQGILKKLKIYSGSEHNHEAQNPQTLEL